MFKLAALAYAVSALSLQQQKDNCGTSETLEFKLDSEHDSTWKEEITVCLTSDFKKKWPKQNKELVEKCTHTSSGNGGYTFTCGAKTVRAQYSYEKKKNKGKSEW